MSGAKEKKVELSSASDFESITGMGVKGLVENRTVIAGNKRLMEKFGVNSVEIDLIAKELQGTAMVQCWSPSTENLLASER